jgi:hypothetical protein
VERALSSPACAINEADDEYMGYAGAAEIQAFLRRLIDPSVAPLPAREEMRPLYEYLAARGIALPPPSTSDVAAGDVAMHASLIGALERLLPRVRDDVLHAILKKILAGVRDRAG